jgi:hypothetical protein
LGHDFFHRFLLFTVHSALTEAPDAQRPTAALAQTILSALDACCKTRAGPVVVIALDCLGKLTAYNFFADAVRLGGAQDSALVSVQQRRGTHDDAAAAGSTLERTPSGTLQGVVDAELDQDGSAHGGAAAGAEPSDSTNTNSQLDTGFMEQVVDIIYHSFSGDTTDEKVQLQIFKVCLCIPLLMYC